MSTMTAAQVMTRDVPTVAESATVRELLACMRDQLLSGVPIVDAGGRAVGLVSQNDLARALALASSEAGTLGRHKTAVFRVDQALNLAAATPSPALDELLARPVKELMTPVVWSCTPDTPLDDICDMMVQRRIHRVVVCDQARHVVGIVSALEVVRRFRDDLRAR
jgi:CBS domain-containing protein